MQKIIFPPPREIKTEADYLELERLSIKLGIPVPMMRIEVKAEKDGKVTGLYEGRSRTWNRNYWNGIYAPICGIAFVATFFAAGYLSMRQVDGTVAAIAAGYFNLNPAGPISNSSVGIIPGRGSAAESFEVYALTTPITHGAGANQLGFRAMATPGKSYSAGPLLWTATLTRLYDNTSGNTITITEAGIYAYFVQSALIFMTCRDLLAAPVAVLNNGVLTITYTITITFPA